ncbi:sigma factor-like helix-turn-helix DNA-binding protein, partial [Acinetobacter baumannii]
LFRIAYNLCIDRARRIERAPVELGLQNEEGEEWIEPLDERWRPDTMVMDVELMDRVEHAIGTMSEKLRVVLLMHDREDASYEEIAEMLKIPV